MNHLAAEVKTVSMFIRKGNLLFFSKKFWFPVPGSCCMKCHLKVKSIDRRKDLNPGIIFVVSSMNGLFDIIHSCWIRGDDCVYKRKDGISFTLPKLPFPRTMRKLKSWMPILTLPGPGVWTGGQEGMRVGDRATGNGSDSGEGIAWGKEGVVASGWGSWRNKMGCLRDKRHTPTQIHKTGTQDKPQTPSYPPVLDCSQAAQFCTLVDAECNREERALSIIYYLII